jgi:opacity protein-like surface antigen
MRGGNFFSEYRLRDATSGQEQQLASGVRNAWTIKEGMIVTTSAERLAMVSGNPQKASAVSASLDYTAADDWKASARTEWRRLDTQIAGDPLRSVQDSFFMNIGGARKLSRDWTALARNYTLATDNHGHRPNGFQNRFQLGAAYRPVDTSTFDLLSMIEHKTERQINAADESREVLVGSVQGNFHPSRPWWFNGKLAFKSVNETFPKSEGGASDRYQATLLSGRAIYDVTENIDIGVLFSRMHSNKKASVQYATGLELGYLLRQNLWLSAGYNFSGFQDRDLTNDYTAKGVYFRLRFKFDQSLFNPRRFDNTISPQTDR